MRRREPPRVVGPYQEKTRWRIVVVDNGQRKSFFCASREEALKQKAALTKEVDLPPSRILKDVLADWEQAKVRSGACKSDSAQHQARRVSLFLQRVLDAEIAMVRLRTSEVLSRVVRDLDDGARYLWIDEGKTQCARRHLEVPSVLSPMLLRLAQGRHPNELLFGVSEVTGKPRPRQAMHRMVRTVCAKARVPRVCTHSLRGLWATLAVKSGAVSHAVAASLGHHSFAVTQKHYAEPAAITNAATARVLDRLAPSCDPVRPSARELLERMDEDTIEQLTELLNARNPKGRGGN